MLFKSLLVSCIALANALPLPALPINLDFVAKSIASNGGDNVLSTAAKENYFTGKTFAVSAAANDDLAKATNMRYSRTEIRDQILKAGTAESHPQAFSLYQLEYRFDKVQVQLQKTIDDGILQERTFHDINSKLAAAEKKVIELKGEISAGTQGKDAALKAEEDNVFRLTQSAYAARNVVADTHRAYLNSLRESYELAQQAIPRAMDELSPYLKQRLNALEINPTPQNFANVQTLAKADPAAGKLTETVEAANTARTTEGAALNAQEKALANEIALKDLKLQVASTQDDVKLLQTQKDDLITKYNDLKAQIEKNLEKHESLQRNVMIAGGLALTAGITWEVYSYYKTKKDIAAAAAGNSGSSSGATYGQ